MDSVSIEGENPYGVFAGDLQLALKRWNKEQKPPLAVLPVACKMTRDVEISRLLVTLRPFVRAAIPAMFVCVVYRCR